MKNKQQTQNRIVLALVLVPIMIFVIVPIFWAISTSLKFEKDVTRIPISYLPSPATLQNYVIAWNNVGFSQFFMNSVIISISAVFFVVIMAIMTGYALSRYNFKGKEFFMIVLLATQFIPIAVLLIPLFNIFNYFNLMGTRGSIILANITFQLPFNSVLMRGFIASIPTELEEAALIDGCSRTEGIIRVVLPILKPGIITVAAFAFIGCWNEFLISFMFLNDPEKFTLPIGLKYMQGQFNINYGALAAGALIAMSIPVVLFAYLQKHLVTGLTSGAIKG